MRLSSKIYLYGLLSFLCILKLFLAILIQEWLAEIFLLPMLWFTQPGDKKFQGWPKKKKTKQKNTLHDIDEKLPNECCQFQENLWLVTAHEKLEMT